jgi:hypothetical protein
MFKNAMVVVLAVISVALCLSGCTPPCYVQPTIEEMQAVVPFKKKIAVLGIDDRGSTIKGVGASALSSLEALLSKQFNLIERQHIAQLLAERQIISYEDPARTTQLGKLLGADYLVSGRAISSFLKPQIEKSVKKDKKGEFHATITKKRLIQSEVSLKIIDVSNGLVIFAQKHNCGLWQHLDSKTFHDEPAYKAALKTAHLFDSRKGDSAGPRQDSFKLAAQSMDYAVNYFRDSLIRQFPYTGEIIERISATEVMVNLGSAYGIRPGDKLVVYSQEAPKIDPRTGIEIMRKVPAIILTVRDVTSGLSCIARGRAADIRKLQPGSVVTTSGRR